MNKDDLVIDHYKKESLSLNSFNDSTMKDVIVRDRETALILKFLSMKARGMKVLDVGCGNGYTLNIVTHAYPEISFSGLEFTGELFRIAQCITASNCQVMQGDARKMPFENGYFDLVYSLRCLINILSWEDQQLALREIHRTLKLYGCYLMIEGFTDGWANYNRARIECGLAEIPPAYHNLYLDKQLFKENIKGMFSLVEHSWLKPNFLSSHYFVSRVLHPLLVKGEFVRNSEFVKFFSYLPPVGNFSPIQAYLLQKVVE